MTRTSGTSTPALVLEALNTSNAATAASAQIPTTVAAMTHRRLPRAGGTTARLPNRAPSSPSTFKRTPSLSTLLDVDCASMLAGLRDFVLCWTLSHSLTQQVAAARKNKNCADSQFKIYSMWRSEQDSYCIICLVYPCARRARAQLARSGGQPCLRGPGQGRCWRAHARSCVCIVVQLQHGQQGCLRWTAWG